MTAQNLPRAENLCYFSNTGRRVWWRKTSDTRKYILYRVIMMIGSEILNWDHGPVLIGIVEMPSRRYSLGDSLCNQERHGHQVDVDSNSDSVSCQKRGIGTARKDEGFCWCHLQDADRARSFSWASRLPICWPLTRGKSLLLWWCYHHCSQLDRPVGSAAMPPVPSK